MDHFHLLLCTWINIAFIIAMFQRSKAWQCDAQHEFKELRKLGGGAYGHVFRVNKDTVIKAFYALGSTDNPCTAAKTDFKNHQKVYSLFHYFVAKEGISDDIISPMIKKYVRISEPYGYCENREHPYMINGEQYPCYYAQSFLQIAEDLPEQITAQQFEKWRSKNSFPLQLVHINYIKGFVHGYMIKGANLAGVDIEFSIGNYGTIKHPTWRVNVIDFGLCKRLKKGETGRADVIKNVFEDFDKYVNFQDSDVIIGWKYGTKQGYIQGCVHKFRGKVKFVKRTEIRAFFPSNPKWDQFATECTQLLDSIGITINDEAHQIDNNVISYDMYGYSQNGYEYDYNDDLYGNNNQYNHDYLMMFGILSLIIIAVCCSSLIIVSLCGFIVGRVYQMKKVDEYKDNIRNRENEI